MPFGMHQFENKLICGKKGGSNFLSAIRPDQNGDCPKGFIPCSGFTSLENTICYDKKDDRDKVCPITGFEFSNGISSLNKANSFPFTDDITFSFSRDMNALPATKIQVDFSPCHDPGIQINFVTYETEI